LCGVRVSIEAGSSKRNLQKVGVLPPRSSGILFKNIENGFPDHEYGLPVLYGRFQLTRIQVNGTAIFVHTNIDLHIPAIHLHKAPGSAAEAMILVCFTILFIGLLGGFLPQVFDQLLFLLLEIQFLISHFSFDL